MPEYIEDDMNQKPEFLKGEAKEFIDAIVQIGLAGAYKIYSIGKMLELKSFYSQPFNPEMIEKYFKKLKDGEFTFVPMFPDICNAGWYYKYQGSHFVFYFKLETLTLSHFISDCIRCGIKLEWKD